VPPIVLTVLKFVFLALLYFFVYRAIRSVVVDLRAARAHHEPRRPPSPPSPSRGRTKPPRTVVVLNERGGKAGAYPLDGNLQIGRADACQIKLSDTYVSQFHARLFSREDGWFVEDLGSTNGTYLNQRRITGASAVSAGDRIKVGKVVMELRR
jgi:pSer/pThr/pTyr-binding forkhead associated (FHA) protein